MRLNRTINSKESEEFRSLFDARYFLFPAKQSNPWTIKTKENKRIAKIPIRTTSGLSGAKNPVNGTLNKAKPAIIQAKNKNGLRSNKLLIVCSLLSGITSFYS